MISSWRQFDVSKKLPDRGWFNAAEDESEIEKHIRYAEVHGILNPTTYNFFEIFVTTYCIDNAYISQSHATNHYWLLSHVRLCLIECSE